MAVTEAALIVVVRVLHGRGRGDQPAVSRGFPAWTGLKSM